jgi:hypothetical protein
MSNCETCGRRTIRNRTRCHRHSEFYRTQNHRNSQRHYARMSAFQAWLKTQPCWDCDHKFPPECMDFDHVRGEKRFNIARIRTVEKLSEEIVKCDLVCANCHRIRGQRRRGVRVSETLAREDGV